MTDIDTVFGLTSEVASRAARIRWAQSPEEEAEAFVAYYAARAALQAALRPTITVSRITPDSMGDRVFAVALDTFLAGLALAAPVLALGVWG